MKSDTRSKRYAVGKSDIVDHYKDPTKPMALRMMGEKNYGLQPGAGID